MNVLPQGKCRYWPWFTSCHKWQRTCWLSYLPWGYICEKRKVDQSCWGNLYSVCVRLSYSAKKLRRLSTPARFIRKLAEECVIPIILYCSPAIFPGLLKHDFDLLRRSIKLNRNVCGLSFSYLTNLVCERHIKASSNFAALILADNEHPLHEELSKATSYTFTRSHFCCNSVLPALSLLLVDRNA